MNTNERVLELLRRAVVILEDEGKENQPTPLRAVQPGEDEVVLEGVIGKGSLREVGDDAVPVYNGSLKVRTPEGSERWIKLTAWRNVGVWASHNLAEGEIVQAVGRWETSTYNGESRPYFSVRLFQAA